MPCKIIMDTTLITLKLKQLGTVTNEFSTLLNSLLSEHYFEQEEKILIPGGPEKFAYFLVEGFAYAYHYNERNNKIYTQFWDENNFIMAENSFLDRQDSVIYIEVIPGSKLQSISFENLLYLAEKCPEAGPLIHAAKLINRENEAQRQALMALTAEEKFSKLLSVYPKILQKVNLSIIAIFMGVTRETATRMKSRYLKSKSR